VGAGRAAREQGRRGGWVGWASPGRERGGVWATPGKHGPAGEKENGPGLKKQ
jgi:hypothetical protein